MDNESIRSLQNPRVKNLIRMRESAHRRRLGKFLIEGQRELSRAVAAGVAVEELFYCPKFFRTVDDESLIGSAAGSGACLVKLSEEAFQKVSMRENPDGFLGLASTWERPLDDLILGANPLVLVVEHVEKPGNLGAIMRSAGAGGVDALIVADPVVDIFNPNVIRASQGVCFDIQVAVAGADDCVTWLGRKGIRAIATTPDARRLHWDVDMRQPTAIVMGSEAAGLSDVWIQPNIEQAKIPMLGMADSLNVSVAAAVFLFEAVRQREISPARS